jgi:squalene-hopene/tetraprenyl-beta-curcumene cyclase
MDIDLDKFARTRANAIKHLLQQRNEQGWWTGQLSSSALSTATAATTLAMVDRANESDSHRALIEGALNWLVQNQNEDGGWGDTNKSFSNISTTTLIWAAFGACDQPDHACMTSCQQWLSEKAGSLEPDDLAEAIMARYGKDRTFSVPILTMTAISGRFGDPKDRASWRLIKQLPFELAAFPQSWFKLLNLQVVSYALPALIAIGQVRHHHRPSRNPIAAQYRNLTKAKTLRVLTRIQPTNGGFLEAAPLTSFVAMSLASCGLHDHEVTKRAVEFLVGTVREDGSWPIDTNLATWVTTLSVNALAAGDDNFLALGGKLSQHLDKDERRVIRNWLLGQQYTEVHPYTGAAPGGWAWTDLPGGVPDADDTSGAILALGQIDAADSLGKLRPAGIPKELGNASNLACGWLTALGNRDGGIPTFCRGWGNLPFDRSSDDITAHAGRALSWPVLDGARMAPWPALGPMQKYLLKSQRPDGAWAPLWFGNQHAEDELNLTYGTSRVLVSIAWIKNKKLIVARDCAVAYLVSTQSEDGGWGGAKATPSSIEETALAVEALAQVQLEDDAHHPSIARGVNWLIEHTQQGTAFEPTPIGYYFAKLWYYEKLYPVIFTVAALGVVATMLKKQEPKQTED